MLRLVFWDLRDETVICTGGWCPDIEAPGMRPHLLGPKGDLRPVPLSATGVSTSTEPSRSSSATIAVPPLLGLTWRQVNRPGRAGPGLALPRGTQAESAAGGAAGLALAGLALRAKVGPAPPRPQVRVRASKLVAGVENLNQISGKAELCCFGVK